MIIKDPYEMVEADYLFLESTYGNRLHRSFEDSKAELLEAIQYAVSNNEKVIIPAFALERTQEVLYLLGEFVLAGQLPDIPIYVDSPLAIKATQVFRRNKKYYDAAARAMLAEGFDPFNMPNLKFTTTTRESIKINNRKGPAIVISANGMCTAGRIKHHLKHNLWRRGASIVIVGFQAEGTTGRRIVEGAKSVNIFREPVAVRAKVFTIGGFSAHADQAGLLEWVGHLTDHSKPKVFAIHGEPVASETLAAKIRDQFNLDVHVPTRGEVLELGPRAVFPVKPSERISVDLRQNMLELTSNLETELTQLKELLASNKKEVSEDDLDKLKEIREDLQDLFPG